MVFWGFDLYKTLKITLNIKNGTFDFPSKTLSKISQKIPTHFPWTLQEGDHSYKEDHFSV